MSDLDDLLDEKPAQKEQEDVSEDEQTADSEEEDIMRAAAAAQREDDDVQALIRRIQSMEAQGRGDQSIVADLERRGISRQAALSAWRQHVEDFPEHGHEETPEELTAQEESLEERVGGAPAREQANPLYDLQNRVEQASNQELYDALEQAETYITSRGGVTDNEYEALNTVEQELNRRRPDAAYESDVVQSIKSVGRLRIGDEYIGNDNQGL